jgi:hypothetical protein
MSKMATQTFVFDRTVVKKGTVVEDGSAVASKFPDMFTDTAAFVDENTVEVAVSRPGQKRTARAATPRTKKTDD